MRLTTLLVLISISAISQNNKNLRFVENKGQWNDDVDFQAQVPGGRVGVSAIGFSVMLLDMEEIEHRHLGAHGAINESTGQSSTEPIDGHYFQIKLLGSNKQSKAIADMPLAGHNNYFLGNDTCRWATHALAFASIIYPNVYDGIDFRVSSIGTSLKYDFILRPGANPTSIKIEYSGVYGVQKSGDDLVIQTAIGALTEQKPISFHIRGNDKQIVPSEFIVNQNIVSFSFPDGYDECSELTIDPLLIFSTYSGSTADNWGSTATPGEHGTLYSAGVTRQDLGGFFPATVGAFQTSNKGSFDMAIIKYDSAGTRFLHATHLGGIKNDSPQSLIVDETTGDLIVLGISSSPDYPTGTNAFDNTFNLGTTIFNRVLNTEDQWDIVLTRLSSNGAQLVGSTFLGGSGNDGLNLPKQSGGHLVVNYGDEMRGDVITDESGHVYISSVTASNNFPIVNGFDNSFNGGTTDGLIVKLSPDLSSIIWSSYLGGSGLDAAYSIKFDADKNIILGGGTTSANFPVTVGSHQPVFKGIVDGWLARVAPDGSAIMNATFTGTASFDQVYFVDLNSDGNIFCYGQTAGHMPITPGVYNNTNSGQFLQKFSPDLSTLEISTVFGSASPSGLVIPNISPTAFLVNDCNNIYMAGWGGFVNSSAETGFWQSTTHGMPITSDAHQKTTSGSDFYFIVLNGEATELVYSTYLGGASSKTHVDGGTSRFDKYGIVYHAVCSGCAFGSVSGGATSDFPTTPNAKSRVNRSTNCNNAAFKFDLSSLRAMFDTNNMDLTMPGFNNVCYPDSIVFQNISTGGKMITWDLGDGTLITQDNTDARSIVHQYQQPGTYQVKLKITDLSTCSQTDSTVKVINYFKQNIQVGEDAWICEGTSHQLKATGGTSYSWTSSDGKFTSSQPSPWVQPDSARAYYVTAGDVNGCSKTDTLILWVIHDVRASFETYDLNFLQPGHNGVCYPDSLLFKNLSVNGEEFMWDFADGTTIHRTKDDTVSITHGFEHEGSYQVKLTASNQNTCNKAHTVTKTINYFKDQITVGEDGVICEGSGFQLTATGGSEYIWTNDSHAIVSSASAPIVRPATTTKYFVTITDLNSCVRKDTVEVTVVDSVDIEWQHFLKGNCTEYPSVFVKNLKPSQDDVTFHFDFGDGKTSQENELEHTYENDGSYLIRLIGQRDFCIYEETAHIPVYRLLSPNTFTPEVSPGYNDNFEIFFGSQMIPPAEAGVKLQLKVVDRWGKTVFESQDYNNDWNGQGLASGVYYYQLKVGEFATCKDWLHIMK